MSKIVNYPLPPDEAVWLDYAARNYENAEYLLNTLASISMACSLLTLYVMIRMKVYKHSLMGIIFFMTILQTCYDATLFSTICGEPSISLDNAAGVQTKAWTKCRSIQMGVVRGMGVGVGVCTNVISAAVAYVIYYERRLPLNYITLAVLVLVPSIIIGSLFGQFFFEQTEAYGMIGFLGGQDNFNIINFVYIAFTTTQFAINVVCVLYISLHFSREGLLCAKREPKIEIGRLDDHNLKMHNSSFGHDLSDPECRDSEVSVGRLGLGLGGPLGVQSPRGDNNVSRSSSIVRGSIIKADAKERFAYPMFLLAKRLMLYPVVQSLVIFGGSYYAYQQGGEATESFVWNATSNPKRKEQTIELFFFSIFMPIAGFGYFLVFMAFQKGSWKALIETFTKELPNLVGLPACTCKCLTSDQDGKDGTRSSTVTDLSSVDQKSISAAGLSSPNPNVHSAYAEKENMAMNIPPPPPESPKSSASASPRQERLSYTYEGSEYRESVAGSSIQGDKPKGSPSYGGYHSKGRFQDEARREDSVAYYEQRMSHFRAVASLEAKSVAETLSASDLCKEDIDEMQEDELIDLIEIAATRKKEAKKRKKANISADSANSVSSSHSGPSSSIDSNTQNPMQLI